MYSSAIIQASASLNQFEESIINALATLKLDVSRNCEPTPKELEKLNELHDGLLILCRKDNDEARKKRCLCVGPIINKFREQAFYMRKRMRTDECPELDSYLNTSQNDITFIVQNSFDENTRKVAILLGAVEVIAELLILNVSLFGMGEDKLENTKVRQYFASALINLSYGNTVTKRKLCFYGHFIHTVTKIISESSALSQVYASLIRNLSWMAEEDMIGRLHETVPALSKAAVRAHIVKDAKTLGATLQALWNLAGHSVNNQKIICEEEGCLDMLISLLSVDPQFSALLETSSGILSCVCHYISTTPKLYAYIQNSNILIGLVKLLKESSFTIISNSLTAIDHLISKNEMFRMKLITSQYAMSLLNKLSNSNRVNIREIVKKVLNTLHHSSTMPFGSSMPRHFNQSNFLGRDNNDMISSVDSRMNSSLYNDKSKLLRLRNTLLPAPVPLFASPNRSNMFQSLNEGNYIHGMKNQNDFQFDSPRSCSLPRQFQRGIHGQNSTESTMPIGLLQNLNFNESHNNLLESGDVSPERSFDPCIGEDRKLEADNSILCQRADSRTSMGTSYEYSQNQSAIESIISTHENSRPTSPISYSDIPDSPTKVMKSTPATVNGIFLNPNYSSPSLSIPVLNQLTPLANHQSQIIMNEIGYERSNNLNTFFKIPNSNSNSESSNSDNLNVGGNKTLNYLDKSNSTVKESDFDIQDGSFMNKNSNLLDSSIESVMLQPKASSSFTSMPSAEDEFLSESVKSVLPKSNLDNESFLMNSIEHVMPVFKAKAIRDLDKQNYGLEYNTARDEYSMISREFADQRTESFDSVTDDYTDNTFDLDPEDDNLDELYNDDMKYIPDGVDDEIDASEIVIDCSELKKYKRSVCSSIPQASDKRPRSSMIPTIVKSHPKSSSPVLSKDVKPLTNKSNLSNEARVVPFNYKKPETKDFEKEVVTDNVSTNNKVLLMTAI